MLSAAPTDILVGAVTISVVVGMLRGRGWSRIAAVVIAAVSAVLNFRWLPHYAAWGLVVIALDVFVIWAVPFHSRTMDPL